MAVRIIHLKNPIAVTLADGNEILTETIRRDTDGPFAVRVDLFSDEGEWIEMPREWLPGVQASEIANVEVLGDDPPPPPLTWGDSADGTPKPYA